MDMTGAGSHRPLQCAAHLQEKRHTSPDILFAVLHINNTALPSQPHSWSMVAPCGEHSMAMAAVPSIILIDKRPGQCRLLPASLMQHHNRSNTHLYSVVTRWRA